MNGGRERERITEETREERQRKDRERELTSREHPADGEVVTHDSVGNSIYALRASDVWDPSVQGGKRSRRGHRHQRGRESGANHTARTCAQHLFKEQSPSCIDDCRGPGPSSPDNALSLCPRPWWQLLPHSKVDLNMASCSSALRSSGRSSSSLGRTCELPSVPPRRCARGRPCFTFFFTAAHVW